MNLHLTSLRFKYQNPHILREDLWKQMQLVLNYSTTNSLRSGDQGGGKRRSKLDLNNLNEQKQEKLQKNVTCKHRLWY